MLRRCILVLFSTFYIGVVANYSNIINDQVTNSFVITDANWTVMLEDEWLVKFFAPWCPACRNLESTWDNLAEWAVDRDLKFGGVDVTQESGLSGRFVITSLPTIYHVKDGIFRQYVGPRALTDFQEYIEEKKWNNTEPVPNWKAPDSFLMSGISRLFGFSLQLKDLHTHVTETYGVPVWASFVLFGVIVVLLGLLLGMIMVLLSDYIYGPPSSYENMEEVQEGAEFEGPMKEMQDDNEDNGDEEEAEEDAKEEGTHEEVSKPTEKEESSVRQRKVNPNEKK